MRSLKDCFSQQRGASLKPRRRRTTFCERRSPKQHQMFLVYHHLVVPTAAPLSSLQRQPLWDVPHPCQPCLPHAGVTAPGASANDLISVPEITASGVTLWSSMGHIRQETCLVRGGRRGGDGREPRFPEVGSCSSITPSSRWVGGRRRLYCTCTCSKVQKEWPGAGKVKPPRAGAQIQQKCPQPARRKQRSRG